MTKSKNTKRALLMSVLSMMLCIAMLAGSTFAWFTDSVTSGKNRIVAGNLDVELYYKNASTKKDTNNASTDGWANASEASVANPNFFVDKDGNDILWEPGVMAVTQFRVANVGSLALKYALATLKADFNSLKDQKDKLHDLSEVIRFAVIGNDKYTEGTTTREDILALEDLKFTDFTGFTAEGHLLPEGKDPSEEIFTVVAYWEPNVKDDNLYNVNNGQKTNDPENPDQLYINIEISLTATQTPYESDSFDQNYDANATTKDEIVKYTFANAADAIAFCPECDTAGTTSGHADHGDYLIVKDGVAEIPKAGAWLSFKDLDWTNRAYAMDYDVDLNKLPADAFIAFDAGETAGWQDLHVGFKRTSSGIEAYKTLSADNLNATNLLGEIGEKVHITYTFTPEADNLKMIATITDEKQTYTVERLVQNFNSNTKLYWDVYAVEGDSDTYAALDNVVFRTSVLGDTITEITELGAILETAKPGDVVAVNLANDVEISQRITVPEGVTLKLNGNGHTIVANMNDQVIRVDKTTAVIENVTIAGTTKFAIVTFADYEISESKSTVTFNNVTVNLDSSTSYPVCFFSRADIIMNNCTVKGAGAPTGQLSGAHIFAGAEVNLTINGGAFGYVVMNANELSGSKLTLNTGKIEKLNFDKANRGEAELSTFFTNNGGTVNEIVDYS